MTEPTGEKRKADSDAEDMEEAVGHGSPIKSRVDEDEDIRRATTLHATLDLLQLHSGSGIAKEADRLGMKTMGLGLWDIDNISNRDRITELVREKKPAFIVGRPQNRSVGHIRFICGLYKLQVREGRWFAHEQPRDSITWK